MCRLQKILLVLLCGGFSLLHGSESRTISLSSLLAPVQLIAREVPEEKQNAEPEQKSSRPTYRMIELSDVLSRMESELSSEVKESSKLSLTSRFSWSGLRVRDDLEWDVRLTTPFTPSSNGRWYPSFELLVDGVVMSEYRIPIQVALFKKVWMVDQNVARGGSVAGAVTRSVIRDVYAERIQPIDAEETLDHFEAGRSLSRGRLLSWDDLEERPQVRKNAIVDVEFKKGALEIRMRGRAMDDGMLGDLVTIRNLNTSREFIALVRGDNLVEFEL